MKKGTVEEMREQPIERKGKIIGKGNKEDRCDREGDGKGVECGGI